MSRGLQFTAEHHSKGGKVSAQRRRETANKRALNAKKMADEGMSIGKIAKHFGVTPQTINNDLKRLQETTD